MFKYFFKPRIGSLFFSFLFIFIIFSGSVYGKSPHCPSRIKKPQKVTVIGTGYVGLVLGACLADLGNEVICADILEDKIAFLQKGGIPIYEPGLKEIVERNVQEKRLSFSSDVNQSIQDSDLIFIAVGTPTGEHGEADISAVEAASATIGKNLNGYKVICVKSTVPIGVTKHVQKIISEHAKGSPLFDIAFNPEFLREGSAIDDFFHPDRVVIGVENELTGKVMKDLYEPIIDQNVPYLQTNIPTAEAIKYASNAFLAVKIAFINEFAHLCDLTGVDVSDVAAGMGLDKRIGPEFLKPGPGYGGSCFPKDTLALVYLAHQIGIDLKVTQAAIDANSEQKKRIFEKLRRLLNDEIEGKTIAVLGLAFKANTDDIRSSPSLDIIDDILKNGGRVKAYDALAMTQTKKIFPEIEYCNSYHETVEDSDAVIILTECEEFQKMDLQEMRFSMKTPILLDARNLFQPEELKKLGFHFDNVGRPCE